MQGIYPATIILFRIPASIFITNFKTSESLKIKKHTQSGMLSDGVVSHDIFSNEFIKDMDILTELYRVLKK